MNPFAKRSDPMPSPLDTMGPLDLTVEDIAFQPAQPAFDQERWTEQQSEERGAGGRQVLGIALSLAAALWLAFTAWSAGRVLVGQPLSSPAVAQWVAIAAGPLALLGLAWLMFGRTRRREAEKFTRSVIAMRSEARSLEALLEVLAQRIGDSHQALGTMAERLMSLGDEATGRLGGVTREFDSSSERLVRHGQALDQAAEAARTDIAVLLDDLPRAEATARAVAEQLRSVGSESATKTAHLGEQVGNPRGTHRRGRPDDRRSDRPPRGTPGRDRYRRSRRGRPGRRSRSEFLGRAQRVARPHLDYAGRNPNRDRRSGSGRGRACRASVGWHWHRRNRGRERARFARRPREFVARRTVGPRVRAGARLAADDRRDRPRAGR